MKIAIDLTSLYKRVHTGVEIFAIDLYHALLKTDHTIIPIFNTKNEIDDNPNAYIIPYRPRLWMENISLDLTIRKIQADIVFFPVFPPPITIYWGCKSKIYKVLHDTIFFHHRGTLNTAAKYYYTPKMKIMIKKADAILTISHTIQQELEEITGRKILYCGENIASEYKNANSRVNIEYLNKWNLQPNRYLVSVSTIEPRKNIKYLLKVVYKYLHENNMKLVLIGKVWETNDKELIDLINRMKDIIIFTGYIENDYLYTLYKYSSAFILLSIHEGFGRTPFEAIACGCKKIILSDIAVFRENFEGNASFLPLNNIPFCEDFFSKNEFKTISDTFKIPFDTLENNLNEILKKHN